jgi:hypothetical protein
MLSAFNTLEEAWASVEAQMRRDPPLDDWEIQEFKDAWYAGCFDCIHIVLKLATENDRAGFDALHRETHAYIGEILEEYRNEQHPTK